MVVRKDNKRLRVSPRAMKILVSIKRVPDPDQELIIHDDQRSIDYASTTFVMNPFDMIALEEALQIRERTSNMSEIIAVGIGGDDYEEQLLEALAMGADRGLLVHCEAALDPWNVARLLRSVVERERPDLVLMGKQAVDDDSNQAGQFLAALLNWPQATFASKLDLVVDEVHVAREIDAGIEEVVVSIPAVITADLRLNQPRYASLPSMLKAKRKPLDRISWEQLNDDIEPRVEVLRLESASTWRACVLVEDVHDLIDRLRHEARVI